MGKASKNYSREQQELLDSGLSMLAQMIAAAHLRRTAFRNALEDTVTTPDKRAPGALPKDARNLFKNRCGNTSRTN